MAVKVSSSDVLMVSKPVFVGRTAQASQLGNGVPEVGTRRAGGHF